jgi:hypothetical protein
MPSEAIRAILADAGHVGAGVSAIPENGPAAVTALDGAIEVIPLVDPADGRVGRLSVVQDEDGFAERDLAEEGEGAVEHAAVIGRGDHDVADAFDGYGLEQVAIGGELGIEGGLGQGGADAFERAEDDGALRGDARLRAERAAQHSADAADHFAAGAFDDRGVAERDDGSGHGLPVGGEAGAAQFRITQPGATAGFRVKAERRHESSKNAPLRRHNFLLTNSLRRPDSLHPRQCIGR